MVKVKSTNAQTDKNGVKKMRFYVMLCTLAAFFMLLIPAVVLIEPQKPSDAAPKAVQEYPDTVTVFLSESENSVTLDMEEYLVGTLAAEMPASYHPQALMAQAAASSFQSACAAESSGKASVSRLTERS